MLRLFALTLTLACNFAHYLRKLYTNIYTYNYGSQSHWVQHIETQYLTGQKGNAELISEFRSDGLGAGCSEVTFLRKGQTMANTRMIWGKHA
jgi:hypothetical protein